MIAIPRLTQLPFDILITGGIGYAIGYLAEINAKFSAQVLVIASLANHILFQIVNHWVRPKLGISAKAIYTGTNSVVAIATILAVTQLELISRRMAGMLIFASLGILAARLKILYD